MSLVVTSPVTGGVQTGSTAPVYTLVTDVAPTINGRQYIVSALSSGTFASLRFHAVSDPFSVTLSRAAVLKPLPPVNPITLRYGNIPKNTHTVLVRKGVNCAANQQPEVMLIRCTFDVPAGSDSFDSPNVRGAVSLLTGVLAQITGGLGDTMVNGVP
jgi:hypothetical protein